MLALSPRQSPAQLLAQLPHSDQARLLRSISVQGKGQLRFHWPYWARGNQLAPPGDWRFWLVNAGRGFGKTRMGAEWIRQQQLGGVQRLGLIAETAGDGRNVMVEGPAGLLQCYPPTDRPKYEPSKRRITWRNGAVATTYSGDEPDQLRGPAHEAVWADEPAKWKYLEEAWSNMDFGLRIGVTPQCCATTTPRPLPWLRTLLALQASGQSVVTHGSTYDNAVNLAQGFLNSVLARYEGTRLGRQELHAELLEDTPGALWTHAQLEKYRVVKAPALQQIVVGIDPGADAGIVAVGLGEDGQGYVLEDASVSGTPTDWATASVVLYHKLRANKLVPERNHGGEMVETTIRTIDPTVAMGTVWASQGKYARAEPVSSLYEQGKIHHVGMFAALEDELCNWVPGEGMASPNRLDALVWACTALLLTGPAAETSSMELAPVGHYQASRGGRYGLAR